MNVTLGVTTSIQDTKLEDNNEDDWKDEWSDDQDDYSDEYYDDLYRDNPLRGVVFTITKNNNLQENFLFSIDYVDAHFLLK